MAALESFKLPAQWVLAAHSFRLVLRRLRGFFELASIVEGMNLRLLQGSLESTISTLPIQVQTALSMAALSQGLSTAGITNSTTVRAALTALAAQLDGRGEPQELQL
ncbi:MAG TPA: hypothetical protein VFN67_02295 [Polyangiales bacterium]|nr:hypothetical protein [Polyangiales bacterium]